MTVSSQVNNDIFYGNGVTTVWDLPFRFFENGDVYAYLVNPVSGISTLIIQGTDYTLTGAGKPEANGTGQGQLTTIVPVANGMALYVERVMALEQQADIINQGKFFPEVHEDVFDRITMLIQQTASDGSNSMKKGELGLFWDALGLRIKNVADPVDNQDAATKGWASSFIASLISVIQGPINNAANIFFLGRDGNSHVVQDLSSDFGAYITGYRANRSIGDRLDDDISLDDQPGIVGNGVADDLAVISSALAGATSQHLITRDKSYRVSARPQNPRGVRIRGRGRILQTVPTGVRQLNTYANDVGIGLMREHFYKVDARLKGGGLLRIQTYGDSTVANGSGGEPAAYYVQNLIPEILAAKGVPRVVVTNYAVSGTQWTDLNAIPNIDATGANTTDLLIIKYGINDFPQDVPTLYNTMRSKIGAIRAATNGDIHHLAILIMTPSSTYDLPHNRDARWYEKLRDMYVAVCEEFQCAFFDTYALMQDTSTAAQYWQDDPFGDGVSGVHFKDTAIGRMWANTVDFIVSDSEVIRYRTNRYLNQGAGSGEPAASTALTNYALGESVYRVTSGWPVNGQVRVVRNVDGGGYQELWGVAPQDKRMWRLWDVGGATWGPWHGLENTPALLNSWVAFGATRKAPTYFRDGNLGYLRGTIKSGTVTVGTSLMVLPAGFRPAINGDQVFRCRGAAGNVDIGINSNGNVFLQSAGDATETCLDGMTWVIG